VLKDRLFPFSQGMFLGLVLEDRQKVEMAMGCSGISTFFTDVVDNVIKTEFKRKRNRPFQPLVSTTRLATEHPRRLPSPCITAKP
jgi:hypothetical protein